MKQKHLFPRFQRRLFGHCLLRSLLWGLTAGSAAVFICALIWHILLKEPSPIWYIGSFGGAFLLGFLPCFIAFYPTKKRTARRLDEVGLQERAGTMLAFRKEDTMMVKLQREDARTHIQNTETRAVKIKLPLKNVIICVICVALGATMLLLPYDLFDPRSDEEQALAARDQQIQALISDLRNKVYEAQLSEQLQKQLDEILDQLEKDLMATDDELEQAALISEAKENIEDTIFYSISRYAIGRAMQQYTLTEGLGLQLEGDHPTQLSDPMDKLLKDVSGPTKQISRLSNNLKNAAEASGIDPSDALYIAVYEFSVMLSDMLAYTEGPDDTPAWTYSDLEFAFELAEAAMLKALEEQAHTEGEMEEVSGILTTGLDSLLEQNGGEVVSSEGIKNNAANNQSSDPSKGEGSSSGTPVGGLFDSGTTNSSRETMLEGIYDPISGEVTYGEVFAAYYAQYLKALEAGEISEELRPYFERYFSSLS